MTKYLLLYRAPVSAAEQMASSTPEAAEAGMEAWMAWGDGPDRPSSTWARRCSRFRAALEVIRSADMRSYKKLLEAPRGPRGHPIPSGAAQLNPQFLAAQRLTHRRLR
jgi:hypothetical protein